MAESEKPELTSTERCLHDLVASQAVQLERMSQMNSKLDKCVVGLYGTASDPSTGLVVRVDRLEQTRKGLLVGFWSVFSGFVALAVHAVTSLLGWKSS